MYNESQKNINKKIYIQKTKTIVTARNRTKPKINLN